ncbi:hypothetical protein TIFTF001_046929 [Ficus carica]|uniref:non-specific serine/threonine protein kinase n=1 Tax=Ficus carica TaxID=3494 RepID=A0AA87YQI6_FICCA|nr:hypothetical protein TIFTF001_046929 [Ficus carica]
MGNFVLKDGMSGESLWQSFHHPGNTFLPSSVLGYDAKKGQNYALTSWKSDSDPSVGNFTLGISPKFKPAQGFIWRNGSTPHWRSGPWAGSKFIGLPDMDASYQSPFDLQEDAEQGTTYFTFKTINSSVLSRMFLSSEGVYSLMYKDVIGGDWYAVWMSPKNPCDLYGVCGPSGLCKYSEYPICRCLKGFVPKSNQEWSKGNWTQGCVRRTELLCEKNTSGLASQGGKKDGFHKFGNIKLPDFYEYVYPPNDIDTCQTWCLDNCSCSACAYVNGIGCLIWSEGFFDIQEFAVGGEDFFLRLAPEELVGGQNNKNIIIIIVATVSCVVTLGAILLIGWHRRRAKKKRNIEDTTEELHFVKTNGDLKSTLKFTEQHDPSELSIVDFNSIFVATDYFNTKNKLGQGGFGPVYKGILQDGTEIAVKRLSSSSGQGVEEFKNEMILISKLQHRNLVRLLGCCIENEERLLIYDFMPNKSLDNFIFGWFLLATSFLVYLVLSIDVSNILLDENMNPKISDFGLARIFEGTIDLANTRRVVGTLGYMSPEYAMGGIFSEKSDVFSFGVLLLEIVSGRKNTSFNYQEEHLNLIAYAWHQWSESKGLDMVDEALGDSYSSPEAMRCIHVGLLCVQDYVTDRPTMPDVVFMLSKETDRPQPKQPLFIFQNLSGLEFQQQNDKNDSKCSVNEATTSIVEGR